MTRPDLFRAYLTEQIKLLIENHGVPVEIGKSGEPIPVHFAYRHDRSVAGRDNVGAAENRRGDQKIWPASLCSFCSEATAATLCVPAQTWMPPVGNVSRRPPGLPTTSITAASSVSMVKTARLKLLTSPMDAADLAPRSTKASTQSV